MDWLRKYADLPEAERLRRIGALVALAVSRQSAARPGDPDNVLPAPVSPLAGERNSPALAGSDATERSMIDYLTRVGAATPRDFQVALGLSPMTITRRLARLRKAGLVLAEGQTRAVRYTLRTDYTGN